MQLLGNGLIHNSRIKREFLKVYNQQVAQLNQSDRNIEIIFGENNDYHQLGKSYPDFDITVRKNDNTSFHYDDPVRLLNDGFAYCFKEARLSTLIGSDVEHKKFCGRESTKMKVISKRW